MPSLKQKTISGLFWNFAGNFANMGVTFVVGVILARLLTPREYGLIGLTAIFIVISQTFIESGFRQALIRKQDCTSEDYSTVFFFNLGVAAFLYFILFFAAGYIASFFSEPELKKVIRVLGLSLIIGSFTIIQSTILTKQINFKLITKISFISALFSGVLGIILAFNNWGVWSLVFRTIAGGILTSILLWAFSKWKPLLIFSKNSFKELFGFGSKLLASNLIDQIYWNIYYVVIGKFFSTQTLGYYTRAEMFKNLPSQSITTVIGAVAFPSLATLQDDPEALKQSFRKVLVSTMLISSVLIIGMAVIARPLIIILIGEKWIQSVEYLQLLCISALFFPASLLNSTMLKIKSRSDIILKLEVFKKALAIPTIIFGVIYGIKAMLLLIIVNAFVDYFINSFCAGRIIGYPIKNQAADLLPSILAAITMGVAVASVGFLIPNANILGLLIQVLLGFLVILLIGELFKITSYTILKATLKEFFLKQGN